MQLRRYKQHLFTQLEIKCLLWLCACVCVHACVHMHMSGAPAGPLSYAQNACACARSRPSWFKPHSRQIGPAAWMSTLPDESARNSGSCAVAALRPSTNTRSQHNRHNAAALNKPPGAPDATGIERLQPPQGGTGERRRRCTGSGEY